MHAAASAAQEVPLSAIDWVNQLPAAPAAPPPEPPVSSSGLVPTIEIIALDDTSKRLSGVIPNNVTGLPETLWAGTDASDLSRSLTQLGTPSLPAAQALTYSLLLTETLPPEGDAPAFQRARIDALVTLGALDPAIALVESIGPDTDLGLFKRYVDLSLIAGNPSRACTAIARSPRLAPDKASEIFCSARNGDWPTAALLFGTADVLGLMAEPKAEALARFLDPELFEGEPPLPVPPQPDAMMFTLLDSLGERPSVKRWPRIYAQVDLTERVGWKSQLEAAERLAQTGAIADNRLLGIYTERKAAASGGIWDRVNAVQEFEAALEAGDVSQISKTLLPAWESAKAAQIEVRLAALFAERLAPFTLSGTAADAAFEMLLLSTAYESAAVTFPGRAKARPFLVAVAAGDLTTLTNAGADIGRIENAIQLGFSGSALALQQERLSGNLGQDILAALIRLEEGAAGDVAGLSGAIASLRALGLEDAARRAALQILLTLPPT